MKQLEQWFRAAAEVAQSATCERRQGGSVIVASGRIIGRGYISPPHDDESQRRCMTPINKNARYPTDKTCCMHAEQRAIIDALAHYPDQVAGASLYYVSLDTAGEMELAGQPYCTICSKLAYDVGLAYFGLWEERGPQLYLTAEYNQLSYANNSDQREK